MLPPPEIAFLTEIVQAQSGQTLGGDIPAMLQRLASLARREGMGDSMELLRLARTGRDPTLSAAIVDAVLPHDTRFFRDRPLWKALREEILPQALRAHRSPQPFRIWSAGCAHGQECYSFSMAAAEVAPGAAVEIVGTDLSDRSIERARSGIYTQFEVQRGLPILLLLKHFEREEQYWRIDNATRRRTRFAKHNLLADMAPLGAFDMISCQDVLSGFGAGARGDVLSRMVAALKPGGVFITGAGEAPWLHALRSHVRASGSPGVFVRTDAQQRVA